MLDEVENVSFVRFLSMYTTMICVVVVLFRVFNETRGPFYVATAFISFVLAGHANIFNACTLETHALYRARAQQ